MNKLYGQLQGNDFLTRFSQFRQAFQGNPRQAVQNLLNSGRITQAQYDNAVRMANQLKGMIK